jgi:hypothetical protein
MGPYVGPIGIFIGLPLLTWFYAYFCNEQGWPQASLLQNWASIDYSAALAASWDTRVFLAYAAYWCLQAALYLFVPCRVVEGVELRDGSRLKYPLNGALCID